MFTEYRKLMSRKKTDSTEAQRSIGLVKTIVGEKYTDTYILTRAIEKNNCNERYPQ